jgi:hypothetical protein
LKLLYLNIFGSYFSNKLLLQHCQQQYAAVKAYTYIFSLLVK